MKRSPWISPVTVGLGIFIAGFGSGVISMMPSTAQPNGRPGNNGQQQQQPSGPPDGCPAPPGPPCPDGKAVGPFLEQLLSKLKLTDKQEDKIDDALDAADAAKKAVLEKYDRSQREEIHKAMKEIDDKTRAIIDSILTKDQAAQLAALEKAQCKNCPPPPPCPCPPPPPGKTPPKQPKTPPTQPGGTPAPTPTETPSGGYS
jgi:Spy/CpxP family protein refolding chaperone